MTNTLVAAETASKPEAAKSPEAGWLAARRLASALFRRHSWVLPAAGLVSCVGLGATLALDLKLPYKFAAAAALAVTSFVWGYWTQAVRRRLFPPLTHLHRRQYAAAWDLLAGSREEACAAVAGSKKDEAEFRGSAASTVQNLLELGQIQRTDQVLEVGCGVGRIGRELAPHCFTWTGADISANMLSHASARLRGINNVRLVRLRSVGLSEFEDNSFDVVYFTNMLMHLDEMDRWQYVEEALRVLRPDGRIFMDIIDIESDVGWTKFTHDAGRYKHLERPPYMPRFSTAAELTVYLEKAGFEKVHTHRRSPLAIVTATRPLVNRATNLGSVSRQEKSSECA
jgi:ubiquinone/menaquinone biosynthesis C-methylase UbiE